MPIFQLELQFDDKGAIVAVNQLNKVAKATGEVTTQKQKNTKAVVDNSKAVDDNTDKLKKNGDTAKGGAGNTEKQTSAYQSLARSLRTLKGTVGAVATLFAVNEILTFGKALLDASIAVDKLNKSYASITGSSSAAREQLDFVYKTSHELGLQFISTAEGAKTFFAAVQGSSISDDMNEIFTSVSKAGTALSLSQDQMQGVFLALGQMVSKGKVQAEELRGQLGERLPGAFQLAAKAMKMSTAELDKFMADGKLLAEDLLPRLADELDKKFGPAVQEAAKGAQQAVNRMGTEWELFKASVLDSGTVVVAINAVTSALKGYNEAVRVEADNARVKKEMEKARVVPLGKRAVSDSWAYSDKVEMFYTSEQIAGFKEARKEVATLNKEVENAATNQEKAIADARASVNSFLKDTVAARKKALSDEYDEVKKRIDLAVEVYKEQRADYSELEKRKLEAKKWYESQVSALGKKGQKKSEADKLTENAERTRISLEQLRQEVGNLSVASDPALMGFERINAKLEKERDNAIAAAEAHVQLALNRKQMTPEQGDEYLRLSQQKAGFEYQQKIRDEETKNLKVKADFYRELSQMTGVYSISVEHENRLIEEQALLWQAAGIKMADVLRMKGLLQLQTSRDPLAGLDRGTRKWMASASDGATQMEGIVTTAMDGVVGAVQYSNGQIIISFDNLLTNLANQLLNFASQQVVSGIFSMLMGFLDFGASSVSTGIGGAGFTGGLGGGSWATGGFTSGLLPLAHGGPAAPAWDLPASGGALAKPTNFWNAGTQRSFATGGPAIAGEAGLEMFMPAKKLSDGNYGVNVRLPGDMYRTSRPAAYGDMPSASSPVTINIINQSSGTKVETRERATSNGKTVDVMIIDLVAGNIRQGGRIASAIDNRPSQAAFRRG